MILLFIYIFFGGVGVEAAEISVTITRVKQCEIENMAKELNFFFQDTEGKNGTQIYKE